jgi:hypothetical protein
MDAKNVALRPRPKLLATVPFAFPTKAPNIAQREPRWLRKRSNFAAIWSASYYGSRSDPHLS